MQKKIEIYTDGSCIGNPGPGGWASLFLDSSQNKILKKISGKNISTTNNRMEMTAVIKAIQYMQKNFIAPEKYKIIIHSDSSLIVQTINSGWKRKANLDLWLELEEAKKNLDVEFRWVKGHSTNKYNQECDRLARGQAEKTALTSRNLPAVKKTENISKKNIQEKLF